MKPLSKTYSYEKKRWTDEDYIEGLKQGDETVIRSFFYELCSYTLNDIRLSLMHGAVDYDDLVNELYIYLSANHWHKLDTFEGLNGCHLQSWMVRLCWRFFMQRRELLLGLPNDDNVDVAEMQDSQPDRFDIEMSLDVESTFAAMPNEKYVSVLRLLLVEGYSAEEVALLMDTNVANLYNIKHRAIVQFIKTYCGVEGI